jgi:hypothetical protein
VSWFLRSMDVVVCAPRPLRIALPGCVDPPEPRPDLPVSARRATAPKAPGEPCPLDPRSAAGRAPSPVKFLAADRVPEKMQQRKRRNKWDPVIFRGRFG